MSKELREEVFNIVHRAKNDTFRPLAASVAADKIVALFNRYAAEREREARIEEVTRIRKRVGGSTVATNEYRAWLDERISALKETTKEAPQ